MPIFLLGEVSQGADEAAKEIDAELQAFLSIYMKRNKREQADARHRLIRC